MGESQILSRKCSLILPSNGARSINYLNASLSFYKSLPNELELNLLFSGPPEIESQISEELKRGLGKRFINCYGMTYVEKILRFIECCDSPYIILLADDDFTFPESILKGIEKLENAPKASAVFGEIYHYTINPFRIKLPTSNRIHESSNESDECRLFQYMDNYYPLYYALHRKNHLKEAFSSFSKLPSGVGLNYLEMYIGLAAVASGQILISSGPWHVRDSNISSGQTNKSVALTYKNRSMKPVLKEAYSLYSRLSNLDEIQTTRIVDQGLEAYVANFTFRDKLYQKMPGPWLELIKKARSLLSRPPKDSAIENLDDRFKEIAPHVNATWASEDKKSC